MALRLWCGTGGGTSLFGGNRLAARLRPIRPSLLAVPEIRRRSGRPVLPAVTIPAQPRAVACRISTTNVDHDHACDERAPLTLVPPPSRRHGPRDDDNNGESGRKQRGGGTSSEKMDQWMQECVVEIVRNIGEAPFLVYVFCNDDGGAGGGGVVDAPELVMEAADPENWEAIRSSWNRGLAAPPGGVILVEELQIGGDDDGGGSGTSTRAREDRNSTLGGGKPGDHGAAEAGAAAASKTWGVLVQGWGGVDCAACYILSTCRVPSVVGFCTHFCLTRARCFEDTADVQLKKLWLVGGGGGTHHHCHRQQR